MRSFTPCVFVLSVCCFSLSVGYIHGRYLAVPRTSMTLVPDQRPRVPTVHLMGMRDGKLHGMVFGSVRFFVGDRQVTATGAFAVAPGPLAIQQISVTVPSWAQFVASRRGKRYYPVFSAGGERIVPRNRIYFRSAQDAEAAGFRKN